MDPAAPRAQEPLTYRPIGLIRSPWLDPAGAPIQPSGARGAAGRAEIAPEYAAGLQDLAGFSHLILLYHCHRAGPARLTVTPFLDDASHGVFATRAPARPNPIGLSVVRLVGVEGAVLRLMDVDVLDATPLIDLKPYVPAFDQPEDPVRVGWLGQRAPAAATVQGDDRFA